MCMDHARINGWNNTLLQATGMQDYRFSVEKTYNVIMLLNFMTSLCIRIIISCMNVSFKICHPI